MKTISGCLKDAVARLGGDTPALEAQVLLAHVLEKPRAWLLAHPEQELTLEQEEQFQELIQRRLAGEPLPYILGSWEFFGLKFTVTPDVLIPRPETERLVELAMKWLHAHPQARLAADIGTGSGCIAVSLAAHVPDLRLIATDISPAALEVARRNAERHGVSGRIDFVRSDVLNQLQVEGLRLKIEDSTHHQPSTFKPLNLLTANLPYIPTDTLKELPIYGHEPTLALDGGSDGLDLIRRLLAEAPPRLAPEALVLLEIEYRQGTAAKSLAEAAFPMAAVSIIPDLAGQDRVLRIET